jgi:hypothetical protein
MTPGAPEPRAARETSESLTLDMDARTRAADAFGMAIEYGYRNHYCAEWNEGDGCTICWEHAADVIRAAEGLRCCSRCKGGGEVDGGGASACCPECGGNGLEPLNA